MTEQQQRCDHVFVSQSGKRWVCIRPWHGARRQRDNHVLVAEDGQLW